MKVKIGTWANPSKYGEINVSYVWDREDKFLVLTDDVNKKKYVPNTFSYSFTENNVFSLLDSYCRNVLNLSEDQIQGLEYHYKGRPNKACHNDDFNTLYKKGYELIGHADSHLYY